MPIDAVCSHCQASYRLADNMLGKQVRCKKCQQPFTVRPEDEPLLVEEVGPTAVRSAGPPPLPPPVSPVSPGRPRPPLGRRPGRRPDVEKSGSAALILIL